MSRLLPLFPLQLVVFPGSVIPLHIFENRYREMVGEAGRNGTEFGIVLAREGGIVNAGCTVAVEAVTKTYSDGRFDVLTRGRRRFRITSIDQEKDYLRGEVEFFDDEDLTPPGDDLIRKAIEAARELGESAEPIDPGKPFLSFRLADPVEDLEFRSVLQTTRSETERLTKIVGFLKTYAVKREYAGKMRQVAGTNGFGHKPADL